VIPFRVTFRPGVPIHEQVCYAATKAVVSGQMRPGDPFPSVRALSKELKINPNTAHKVVGALIDDGLLEVIPGIGTLVARVPASSAAERSHLLDRQMEELVVEAVRLGLSVTDLNRAMEKHWNRIMQTVSKD